MDGLYEHYPKLKSTSSCCCMEARGLVLINAQSNNLFLVIRVGVAGRDNGGEPTDREVLPAPTNKDIADKKLLAIGGRNTADEGPPAITDGDIADKRAPVIGDEGPTTIGDKRPLAKKNKKPPAIENNGLLETTDKGVPAIGDKRPLVTRDKRLSAIGDEG